MSGQRAWEDERGITLAEVMVTILVMGIVFAIAISTVTWSGVIESRRVDSATNQLASDLRQAHSKAINRLAPQTVTLVSGSSEYTMTGMANPIDLDEEDTEDVVEVNTASTIVFNANGSATITGANPITVESSKDPTKNHTIEVNAVTSRVQVVP